MNVAIPPEFERFAREQVEAGAVASEEEAVAAALREYLADLVELRVMVEAGFASVTRGEGVDGEVAMRDLIEETRALHGE